MATSVLIIDPDPSVLRLLEQHLTANGYAVHTADSDVDALRIAKDRDARIVIVDLMMPGMREGQFCRALRSSVTEGAIHILTLATATDAMSLTQAFWSEADDLLLKPVDFQLLDAKLRTATLLLKLEDDLVTERRAADQTRAQLTHLNNKLQRLATIDALTELPNRQEALRRLDESWALTERQGLSLSCVLIGVDQFKRFDEENGPAAADAVLRSTAKTLRAMTRTGEPIFRIGNSRFLLICPGSKARQAITGAERMRKAVETSVIKKDGFELSVTVSIGVAQRDEETKTITQMLALASKSLDTAKQAGGNRLCVAGQDHAARLPLANASATDGESGSQDNPEAVTTDMANRPMRVMIVDDSPDIRLLCRRLLEKEGYEVVEACDGMECFKLCEKYQPDIIVMDIDLPKLSGLECTRRLKANPAMQDMLITMMSSHSDGGDIKAAFEAQADEFITKPFKPRQFIYRIRLMERLQRSRYQLVANIAARGGQARALMIMLDLSRSLTGTNNLEEALDCIISAAVELTGCMRVSIMLPDDTGKYLRIARSIGVPPEVVSQVRIPIGGNVAGQVYASQEPVQMNQPTNEKSKADQHKSLAPLVSAELRTPDRVVGVINATERHGGTSFDPLDLEYFDLVCNLAASAIDVIQSRHDRDEAHNAIVFALAKLADHRDNETGKHLDRVSLFSVELAQHLRTKEQFRGEIDNVFVNNLKRAVPLHDIGKVAIPDRILFKPGKLTDQEMAIMRTHVDIGAQTLQSVIERTPHVGFLNMALDITQGHHEWYNGKGYPNGVSGEDIPLSARIAAIADVYDALTTRRPYKEPFPHQKTVDIIKSSIGTQFDPVLGEAFMAKEKEFARLAAELADEDPADIDDLRSIEYYL